MEPSNLIAVISPCIRPPHYEEDIPTAIKAQLIEAGVPEEQIHDSGLDTAADTKRFYSYRMEKGKRAACWPFSARITLHGRTQLFFNSGKAELFIPYTAHHDSAVVRFSAL